MILYIDIAPSRKQGHTVYVSTDRDTLSFFVSGSDTEAVLWAVRMCMESGVGCWIGYAGHEIRIEGLGWRYGVEMLGEWLYTGQATTPADLYEIVQKLLADPSVHPVEQPASRYFASREKVQGSGFVKTLRGAQKKITPIEVVWDDDEGDLTDEEIIEMFGEWLSEED